MPPDKHETSDTMAAQDKPQLQRNSVLESEIDAAVLGYDDADHNGNQALCRIGLGQDDEEDVKDAVKVLPTRKQLNIIDLPVEIIIKLFLVIKHCEDNKNPWWATVVDSNTSWQAIAICLGLTCKKFWIILQSHIKIGLVPIGYMVWYEEIVSPWGELKSRLLDDWIGPRYRYCDYLHRYLNREVYGDVGSVADVESRERRRDWNMIFRIFEEPDELVFQMEITPNPFGKGWQWNEEMYDLFLGGSKDFEHEIYELYWKRYWRSTYLVKKVRDKRMWEALEEWIQMVGF